MVCHRCVASARDLGLHLYAMANGYSKAVETGAYIVSETAAATASIASSTIETLVAPLQFAKETAQSLFGISDFRKGAIAMHRHQQTLVDAQDPRKVVVTVHDPRTFSQRVGEMNGHLISGFAKMCMTSTAIAAYVTGTLCNHLDKCPSDSFVNASQAFTSSVNTFASLGGSVAARSAVIAGHIAKSILSPVFAHPVFSAKATVFTGLMGASLYLACSEGVRAADAKTISAKVGHTALTIAGIAGACLTPMMLDLTY